MTDPYAEFLLPEAVDCAESSRYAVEIAYGRSKGLDVSALVSAQQASTDRLKSDLLAKLGARAKDLARPRSGGKRTAFSRSQRLALRSRLNQAQERALERELEELACQSLGRHDKRDRQGRFCA